MKLRNREVGINRRLALLLIVACIVVAAAAWAQGAGNSATVKQSKTGGSAKTEISTKASDGSLPSQAEVESFLRHMFGYNPAATWKIVGIQPSEAPNVAHIVAVLGNNPTATHLYVMPDGKYVVVGDMIPFGADPYADTRAKFTLTPRQLEDDALRSAMLYRRQQMNDCVP